MAVVPIGVANDNFGGGGRPDCCEGNPDICTALFNGLTLGEGGIASPNLGVRLPLDCLPPGIGGRSKGAGEDMLDGGLVEYAFVVRGFKKSAWPEDSYLPAKVKYMVNMAYI